MATVTPQYKGQSFELLQSIAYDSAKAALIYGSISVCTGGAPLVAGAIGALGTAVNGCLSAYFNAPSLNRLDIEAQQKSSHESSSKSIAFKQWSAKLVTDAIMLVTSSACNAAAATGGKITQEIFINYMASATAGVLAGRLFSTQRLMASLGINDDSNRFHQFLAVTSEIVVSCCIAHETKAVLSNTITEQISALSNDSGFVSRMSKAAHIYPEELRSRLNDTTAINNTAEVLSQFSEQQLQRAVRDLSQDAANNITSSDTSGAVAASGAGGLVLVILVICGVLAYKCCGSDSSSS